MTRHDYACRAPEQTGDTFGLRDRHTDVWGFGTTILHMATGVLPYNGLNLLQMLTALMKGRPPAVPKHSAGLVAAVVEGMPHD